jgi:hypothetical protein
MSGPANLIANQFTCPRDVMVFRSLCDTFYHQVDVPKRLHVLGNENAEFYLCRVPGVVEDLTVISEDEWCGFHKVLPYIGASLKRLDIRYRGTVSLSFLELLPNLEHLTVTAKGVPHFPGALSGKHSKLRTIRMVTTDHIVLPGEFATVYPNLETLDIACYSLGCSASCRLPQSLRNLSVCANSIGSNLWVHALQNLRNLESFHIEGSRFGHVPEVLGECPALKSVTLRDLALEDVADPDLHYLRHVETLDLSGNPTITSQDLDGIEAMESLETLDLRGCLLFDSYINPQAGGWGSASIQTLHLSQIPPITWLSRFQNLEHVYVHPEDPPKNIKKIVREATCPPDDREEHSNMREIYVPESSYGGGFIIHLHADLSLNVDDVALFSQYFSTISS